MSSRVMGWTEVKHREGWLPTAGLPASRFGQSLFSPGGQQPAGGAGFFLLPFIILAFCQKQTGEENALTADMAVPLRGTNAKTAMVAWPPPCSAGLRGAAEGASRVPYMCTHWDSETIYVCAPPALKTREFLPKSAS